MPTPSGYSNQKMFGPSRHQTVQTMGSDRVGVATAQMYLYEKTPLAIEILSAVKGSTVKQTKKELMTEVLIEFSDPHNASRYDIMRIMGGALEGWEFEIIKVVDATKLVVFNIGDVGGVEQLPEVGSFVKTLRWTTALSDQDGALQVSQGPVQFIKNQTVTEVSEDTADATNNNAMPSGLYIYKDGLQVPVTKTTGVPSNTVPVPVEIVAAEGTEINITAGDINVQTTDMGLNFDSMRIGDGSGNYIEVTSDKEARVTDAKVLSAVESLEDAVDLSNADLGDIKLATEATQAAVESLDGKDFATEVTLDAVKTAVESLEGKDFSTETKQDDIISELETLNTVDFATEAKQDGIISELQTIAGLDFSTETKQDGIISELETLNTVDFATEATVNDIKTKLNSMAAGLVPQAFDHMTLSYVPGTTDISTVVYRIGGSGGAIVATITLGYDGDGNISTVARS